MAAKFRKIWLLWLLVPAGTGYVAVLYFNIVRQSTRDERRPADAIVVFGAAQYDGRPSPVYKARLDHAAQLYQEGFAPMVITTGGAGEDPKFNEGVVGREYLKARGVPDRQLIAETQSPDTAESARRVANIMRVNGMHYRRSKRWLPSFQGQADARPRENPCVRLASPQFQTADVLETPGVSLP